MKFTLLFMFAFIALAYTYNEEINNDGDITTRDERLQDYELDDGERELVKQLSDDELDLILSHANQDFEEKTKADPKPWGRRRRRRRSSRRRRRFFKKVGKFVKKHGKKIWNGAKLISRAIHNCCFVTLKCQGKWYCFAGHPKGDEYKKMMANDMQDELMDEEIDDQDIQTK